jgi:hypothetical protein
MSGGLANVVVVMALKVVLSVTQHVARPSRRREAMTSAPKEMSDGLGLPPSLRVPSALSLNLALFGPPLPRQTLRLGKLARCQFGGKLVSLFHRRFE